MTKLLRDARAFARRAKMSAHRIFAVVEGRNFDRPYYERLLEQVPYTEDARRISVRLAEEIELDGESAGGKSHALQLREFFESRAELKQSNQGGDVLIMFFLDRDVDDFVRGAPPRNVVHTEMQDVEAQILWLGDLKRAVGSSHGLASAQVTKLTELDNIPGSLAALWREWILLRLIAESANAPSTARFAQTSQINKPWYGAIDPAAHAELCSRVATAVGVDAFSTARLLASTYFDERLAAGRSAELVKGKWAASYVLHYVHSTLSDETIRANVSNEALLSACLETIEFKGDCVQRVEEAIDLALSS
ncbi:MAG: hypothetical protein EPO52_11205 [Herbiconiux sp.]|uniref:hypothetical protein n=1 Tax=Herbiconiux sp. TaxID=1871186 RepID=UPI0011F9EC1B|nr:hypothetical protein [Herbiconiux sp.]TAJ48670.1 MAG: hypothetical protein EPO52_11205 [Herbiconiux sp.]